MVIVSNQISSGKERLVAIGGELAQAEQQAADAQAVRRRSPQATIARREAVTKVAKARFDWDKMLIQLASVAPGDVWLTSAKAHGLQPAVGRRRRRRQPAARRLPRPGTRAGRLRQARERRPEVHGPPLLDHRRQRDRLRPHREVERQGQRRRPVRGRSDRVELLARRRTSTRAPSSRPSPRESAAPGSAAGSPRHPPAATPRRRRRPPPATPTTTTPAGGTK